MQQAMEALHFEKIQNVKLTEMDLLLVNSNTDLGCFDHRLCRCSLSRIPWIFLFLAADSHIRTESNFPGSSSDLVAPTTTTYLREAYIQIGRGHPSILALTVFSQSRYVPPIGRLALVSKYFPN